MGITRKILSFTTMGAVDFRSDKERIAHNTGITAREGRRAARGTTAQRITALASPAPGQAPQNLAQAMGSWSDLAEYRRQRQNRNSVQLPAPGGAEQTEPAAPPAPVAERLAQLRQLQIAGQISDGEYDQARARILDQL
ncbi:hypothetical protein [Streptacidiphilus cavernicola]|uniref:SHOCT domain-containing protein n=1 Tax=Streptacidiphilus cavernicola TaxID=3342716 RepID=A0ABV6VYF6_9ACTN